MAQRRSCLPRVVASERFMLLSYGSEVFIDSISTDQLSAAD